MFICSNIPRNSVKNDLNLNDVILFLVYSKMSNLPSKEALRLCKETTDINVIVDLTKHDDPMVGLRISKQSVLSMKWGPYTGLK